jgi:polyvinyl alcohol dehydrogenase (cytochrome)
MLLNLTWTRLSLLTLACAACGPGPVPGTGGAAGAAGHGGTGTVTPHWSGLGFDLSSSFNNANERALSTGSVARLKAAWTTTAYGTVNGAAALAGDIVYIQSGTGTYALRVSNGQLVWQNLQSKGTSSPTYSDGVLFVNDSASVLRALNAATGQQLWQVRIDPHPLSSGMSSPVVHERYVIVGSSSTDEINNLGFSNFRGAVVAYDRTTGQQIWRRYTVEAPFNGVAVWSSVSIDPALGLVFATNGNNYTGTASNTSDAIFAIRLSDGSPVWSTQLTAGDVYTTTRPTSPDYDFGTNPVLFDATINGLPRKLVGAGQKSGMFWALDRQTGGVIWSRQVSPGSGLVGGVFNNGAYDGERILVAGNLGTSSAPGSEPYNGESNPNSNPKPTPGTALLAALDPATGNSVWERQLPAWVWAPITVANGVGFVAYETQLQAFDVRTGAKLFNYKAPGTITSAPVAAEGAVYFGSGLTYYAGHPDRTFHALSLSGTGSGGTGGTGGGTGTTFTAIYSDVFVASGCTAGFCHGGTAGNLAMSTQAQAYANLVGVSAAGPSCGASGWHRVKPFEPNASLLINKIANATPVCGTSMPPNQLLPAAQVERVRAWIAAGAQND